MNFEFLSFSECPNAAELRSRLRQAMQQLHLASDVHEVDLESLPVDDPRLRYGAPTILLNGSDLMGATPLETGALCCRTYELGELPDLDQLRSKLTDFCSATRGDKE